MATQKVSKAQIARPASKSNIWDSVTPGVAPSTPSVTNPSQSQSNVSRFPLFIASPYSSPTNSPHVSSDWQIATNVGFSTIVWSSTEDTYNKQTTTAAVFLKANTTYYVRVRYRSENKGVSDWSSAVAFTTGTTGTSIGAALAGGYYFGTVLIDSVYYYLIVSPKASGQSPSPGLIWRTSNVFDSGVASVGDGPRNCNNMNDASHPANSFCKGLSIGGYSDWYLPSVDELELCYRNLKPSTDSNVAGYGVNNSSSPTYSGYTTSAPAQTTAAAFKSGGSEAFNTPDVGYWSSTGDSTSAYLKNFTAGYQFTSGKGSYFYVRAIRRIRLLT